MLPEKIEANVGNVHNGKILLRCRKDGYYFDMRVPVAEVPADLRRLGAPVFVHFGTGESLQKVTARAVPVPTPANTDGEEMNRWVLGL